MWTKKRAHNPVALGVDPAVPRDEFNEFRNEFRNKDNEDDEECVVVAELIFGAQGGGFQNEDEALDAPRSMPSTPCYSCSSPTATACPEETLYLIFSRIRTLPVHCPFMWPRRAAWRST